jgi:hypothetical protein
MSCMTSKSWGKLDQCVNAYVIDASYKGLCLAKRSDRLFRVLTVGAWDGSTDSAFSQFHI